MKGWAGRTGTHLISWSQTEIDGRAAAPEAEIGPGAYWRWSGEAVAIDAAIDAPLSESEEDAEILRRQAAKAARNVIARALGVELPKRDEERTFTLTSGRKKWTATIIDTLDPGNPILVFAGSLPPPATPMRITHVARRSGGETRRKKDGVFCFTPGTWVETPGGARQIDFLSAGDKIVTLDSGPQEIVWIGSRRMSVGDLVRNPDFAPVRISEGTLPQRRGSGDLLVSPDHLLLLRGRRSGPESAVSEALVAARDLVDGKTVRRTRVPVSVTYIHLLLEQHHVICANGFETESFHPGYADLSMISQPDYERLLDLIPDIGRYPRFYGPPARPVLSRAEAALLAA